jgi:hypothetical protein
MLRNPNYRATQAVVVAGLAAVLYPLYSATLAFGFGPLGSFYAGDMLAPRLLSITVPAAGVVASVSFLAWKRGMRTAAVASLALLLLSPFLFPGALVWRSVFIRFRLSLIAILPVGLVWTVKEKDEMLSFVRGKTGRVAVAGSLVHILLADFLQSVSRARSVMYPLEFLVGEVGRSLLRWNFLGVFSVLYLYILLFLLVFLGVFLWSKKGLFTPLAVATVWVLWGAWSNYALWDVYPVTYPLEPPLLPARPAPDYAIMVTVPISIMLLSAVLERSYRELREETGTVQ